MTKHAIEKKMRLIYFADHFELNNQKNEDMTFDLSEYKKEIQRVNKKYTGIEVLSGLELDAGEHQLSRFNQMIDPINLDFVILSVHKVDGIYLNEERWDLCEDAYKLYESYYSEVLNRIKAFDNFDALGHLDLIDRYHNGYGGGLEFSRYKNLIIEILRRLIQMDKALEVNTNGYHTQLNRPFPKTEILTLYRKMGGEKIIIGSDAHVPQMIGFRHKGVLNTLKKLGFTYVTIYRKRIPHMVRI
jgi:histidinol-phosphatase (PHP family)